MVERGRGSVRKGVPFVSSETFVFSLPSHYRESFRTGMRWMGSVTRSPVRSTVTDGETVQRRGEGRRDERPVRT